MSFFIQIVVSGLTLGAMYALAAVGLALVWGSFNMLNMSHGVIMTLGAYFALIWAEMLGFPLWMALPFAMVCGAIVGIAVYFISAHWMLRRRNFDVGIIIATFGIGMAMETSLLRIFGGEPFSQPLSVRSYSFMVGEVPVSYQRLVIWGVALVLILLVGLFLTRTDMGRAVRAVAQNRDGARLVGVPVRRVYVLVLGLASALAAVSGIMLSSIKDITPLMGGEPLLKAFIVIVLSGLGNVVGALYAALIVGMIESAVSVMLGAQYGFTAILLFVIFALLWRPAGIFGRAQTARQ
jgi:branched-subunit amino acid ABC-type transport system permease component